MDQETAKFVFDKLEQWGTAMGQAVSEGAKVAWPLVVKQNYVYAIADAVVVIICSIILFRFSLPAMISYWKEYLLEIRERKDKWESTKTDQQPGFWIATVSAVFMCAFIFPFGYHVIARFVNPHWMALQDVINLIR